MITQVFKREYQGRDSQEVLRYRRQEWQHEQQGLYNDWLRTRPNIIMITGKLHMYDRIRKEGPFDQYFSDHEIRSILNSGRFRREPALWIREKYDEETYPNKPGRAYELVITDGSKGEKYKIVVLRELPENTLNGITFYKAPSRLAGLKENAKEVNAKEVIAHFIPKQFKLQV